MKIKYRYMSPEPDGGAQPPNDVPPPATIINDPPAGDPPPTPPAGDPPAGDPPKAFYESMPEDWRNQIIDSLGIEDQAEKDKRLGQLNRFSDIKSMSKTLFESQDKIRSGQIETGLPENATDEQIKDYREANGIPESAEGYAEFLDEGLVLGEADQRIMGDVYKTALDNNVPAETIAQLTSAMMAARQTEQDGIVAQDGVDQQQTERMAKEMWGGDYQANINMISGHLNKLPAEIKESFINGRLSDGKAIMNSPEILSFLSDAARLANPAGTVVPNSSNPGQSIKDEIKTLEAKMGTDEWFKDKDGQARYQQLVDTQAAM